MRPGPIVLPIFFVFETIKDLNHIIVLIKSNILRNYYFNRNAVPLNKQKQGLGHFLLQKMNQHDIVRERPSDGSVYKWNILTVTVICVEVLTF